MESSVSEVAGTIPSEITAATPEAPTCTSIISNSNSHHHTGQEGKNLREHRLRVGLLVCSCVYTLVYVGAFFGWGPLQLMFEENGSFNSQCSAEDQTNGTVCDEQTAALVNAHFAATTTQLVAPFLGQILDRYGATKVVYLMTFCILAGIALLACAAQFHVDSLIYVGLIVLAMGTWFGGMVTIQTGLYFQGKAQHRVIVALNSMFDSGAITYLGLWATQEATGASTSSILVGYLLVGVVVLGSGCYFWTVATPDQAPDEDAPKCEDTDAMEMDQGKEILRDEPIQAQKSVQPDNVSAKSRNSCNCDALILNQNNDNIVSSDGVDAASGISEPHTEYILIRDRTPFQQLTSMPALVLALYFTIHVTCNQWVMTTTRDFLASLGDDDYNNRYLTIFTLIMPASLLFIPCVDIVLNRYGFAGGFQLVNLLALSYNLVRLTSDNLNVQILGFILFSCFRCFLFGFALSFLPTILAPNVNGKAAGLLYATTGAFSFINIPIARVTIVRLDGDYFVTNLAWTLMVFPCIVLARFIGIACQREERAKNAMLVRKPSSLQDPDVTK